MAKRTKLTKRVRTGDQITRDSLTITVLKGNAKIAVELNEGERCVFVNAPRLVVKVKELRS